jgi:hypothetical protein
MSMEPADTRPALEAAKTFIDRMPWEYALAVVTLALASDIRFETDRKTSAHA